MRATTQRGRGKARHNDRHFDTKQAEHIDGSRTSENIYWHVGRADLSFAEAELDYYEQNFGGALEKRNRTYVEKRMTKHVWGMQDFLDSKKYCPREALYQVGNAGEQTDPKLLFSAYINYLKKFNAWNKEHGGFCQILNVAEHKDEATPHIHERSAWYFFDEEGVKCTGNLEESLRQAGVEPPTPYKDGEKASRHNNRLMTFTSMTRDMFLESCREVGLEIEQEPLKRPKKSKTLALYAIDKEQELQDRETALNDREKDFDEQLKDKLATVENEIKEKQDNINKQLQDSQNELKKIQGRVNRLKRQKSILEASDELEVPFKKSITGKVVLEEQDFQELVGKAEVGQAINIQSQELEKERKRIMNDKKKAEQIKKTARKEAEQIKENARKESNSLAQKVEKVKLEKKLHVYEKLEELYPDKFRDMRAQIAPARAMSRDSRDRFDD